MVYYIRFLKPPMLDTKSGNVRALITITTDLGDDFYPGSLTLHAVIITDYWEEPMTEWYTVLWKKGMRTAWIEVGKLPSRGTKFGRLLVSTQCTEAADTVLLNDLPEILSARSDTFGWDDPQAGNKIERRYKTAKGERRSIYEETGESIARHIWDAGIALAAFLNDIVLQPQPISHLAMTLTRTTPCGPKILELGSGCGIVGLEIAHLCPISDVLLTDLPEAMAIMDYNVSKARKSSGLGKITTATLDWEDALPELIRQGQCDLVMVSDCTYNSDSIPALVKTLAAVIERSPAALVVVAMKIRHDSEAVFFDLMGKAGLIKAENYAIPLPDQQRADTEQALEAVDVYVFRKEKDERADHS